MVYTSVGVGAYMYGWRLGLLTAIASPVINSLLFGMPAANRRRVSKEEFGGI